MEPLGIPTLVPVNRKKRWAMVGWLLTGLVIVALAIIYTSDSVAFLSVCVLSCSAALVGKTTEIFNFRRITILSFWYLTYLVMIFAPAFVVFSDHEGPFRSGYLFAVESVLLTVPLGALLVSKFLGFHRAETDQYFEAQIAECQYPKRFIKLAVMISVIVATLTILYFHEVKTVPLFYMLANPGEHAILALLREDSFKLLDSPFTYAYFLTREILYPFLICIFLGYWLKSRAKKWLFFAVLTGCGGVLFCGASGAKAPVAAIFLVIVLFVYVFKKGIISKKMLATFTVLIWLFPLGVVYLAYLSPEITTGEVFQAIGKRMLYVPSEVVYYYFEVFPSNTPYLHGRSIDKLARLFNLHFFDSANYVGLYAYSQFHIDSINANGAFIADLNANFGMYGVLLGGIVAGAIIQFVHIYLIRKQKTIVNVACYAYLIFAFWNLHSMPLPIVLASDGVFLAIFLLYLFDHDSFHYSVATVKY